MSQELSDAQQRYYDLRHSHDRAFRKVLALSNYGTPSESQAARDEADVLSKQLYEARKLYEDIEKCERLAQLVETFAPFAKSDEAAREIAKLVYEMLS